jgi:hypothetical protein
MNNRLGYSFQHGPRLENESRKNDSTQVCTRSQLGDDVRKHISLIGLDGLILAAVDVTAVGFVDGRPSA